MDPQLGLFINDCYLRAVQLGHTNLTPVILEVDNEGTTLELVVSYVEPLNLELRSNTLWINTNDGDENYLKLLRRESKNVSATYQHTWSIVVQYTDLQIGQFYSQDQLIRLTIETKLAMHQADPDAHPGYIKLSGNQQMSGPLVARPVANLRDFAQNEMIPRSVLTDAMNNQTQGFYYILMGMNDRITVNEEEILLLKNRLNALETGSGSGNPGAGFEGARVYVHVQNEPDVEWIINHQLDTVNLNIQVWVMEDYDPEEQNEPQYTEVIPETKRIFDPNFALLLFNTPVAGRAIIVTHPS